MILFSSDDLIVPWKVPRTVFIRSYIGSLFDMRRFFTIVPSVSLSIVASPSLLFQPLPPLHKRVSLGVLAWSEFRLVSLAVGCPPRFSCD